MNLDPQIAPRASKAMISGTFVRNAWYVVTWSEDLLPEQVIARTVLNEAVVIFRKADGTVCAMTDRCSHRFAPLSLGKVLGGDRIQCPYHGLEFDGAGQCVLNPHGNGRIAPSAHVKSYPVVEKHRAVWIWMGDKPADPEKVPDFSALDTKEEGRLTKCDCIVLQANYELVVDNLLDLSHVSYLHDGILGNQDTVDSEITVEQDGDTVTVGRYATNAAMPGMFAFQMPGVERVDKWSSIRWSAPSCLILVTGVKKVGDTEENGTGYYGIHLLTPETDRTTRYHFTAVRWNVLTDPSEDQAILDRVAKMRRFAFADQDAPVIEAQQAAIDQAGVELDPVLLSIDVGPVRYKRIIQRLIAAEQA